RPGKWLIRPIGASDVIEAKISQDGFAGDGGLAFGNQRHGPLGQEHVQARTETNEAEALADAEPLPFANKANDAACHQPSNLDHPDAPVWCRDDEGIAFIVLARLVELGVDEYARPIRDAVDPSRDRATIDVTVEDTHEDRDPRQRPVAEAEL